MAEPKHRKTCSITSFFPVVSDSCSSTTQSSTSDESREESGSIISGTTPQNLPPNWMGEFSWLLNVGEGMLC